MNVCGKYRDMGVMASRTFLVNPDDKQKKIYLTAIEALDFLIKNLVVGEPIKNAYVATKEFIKSKDASLASKVHSNLGFGVSTFSLITNPYRSATVSERTHCSLMRPTIL